MRRIKFIQQCQPGDQQQAVITNIADRPGNILDTSIQLPRQGDQALFLYGMLARFS